MRIPTLLVLVASGAFACRRGQAPAAVALEAWSVTAWGERYEVFAETEPLIAGLGVTSNAHVTVLSGFSPLKQGAVTLLLRGNGSELAFRQERPKREGIFPVAWKPPAEGTFDLVFRIESAAGGEDLAAGKVRVGSAASPGGTETKPAESGAQAVPFLKEQQWRTEFATEWVREGSLADGVSGPAQIKPAAGGEVVLTAALDAIVAPEPWPYVGRDVAAGAPVFKLIPRIGERSVPELRAEAASLEAEIEVAKRRVERLSELLKLEATSQAELERARATLASLEARHASARGGANVGALPGAQSASVPVSAPWNGRVAEVSVSPGQAVAAGAPLGRVVKLRPLWIVVALRPEDAARVQSAPRGLFLRRPGLAEPIEVRSSQIRYISQSPEVDARTASVGVILEADRSAAELPFGSAVEAQLLLAGERKGVAIPLSALVDDSGTPVAYVQVEGESFARRELRVLNRLGSQALVEGLRPGERLVARGAAAVRRASLLSSGAPEGHVH